MASDAEFFGRYKHPLWQKKRLWVMQRDGFRCLWCGTDSKLLHVHHNYYEKHLNPWEYPDHAYQTLCEDCHPEMARRQLRCREIVGALRGSHFLGVMSFAYGVFVGGLASIRLGGEGYDYDWVKQIFPTLNKEKWHRDSPATKAFLAGLLWAVQDGRLGGQVADLCSLNIAESASTPEWLLTAMEYLDPFDLIPDCSQPESE